MPITTSSSAALEDFLTGRSLLDNLRNTEANRYFESAIVEDKEFALAYYYLGISSATAKGFFANLKLAQEYAPRASEGERLLIEAGEAGAGGDLQRQTEILAKLAQMYPEDQHVRMFFASYLFQRQMYDSAAMEFQAVVEMFPDFAPPYNMLGYTYRALERYEEAGEAFKKYIELIPGDPNPYDSYAELLMRLGKCEEAIEYYRRALAMAPSFAPSRLGIATCLVFLDRHTEARAELTRLYDSAVDASQRAGALFAEAVTYADEGNFDAALQALHRQYLFDSSLADFAAMSNDLQNAAFLQVWTGQTDAAAASYDKSLALVDASDLFERVKQNAHLDDLLDRSRVLMVQGKLDEARALAEKHLGQANELNAAFRMQNAHTVLGQIALKAKDYQSALDHLEQANTQRSWVMFHMAQAYEGLGDSAHALEYYQKVASAYERNSLPYALVRNRAIEKIADLAASPAS
jgi:tetratricopeptide (TPR) repeat protein